MAATQAGINSATSSMTRSSSSGGIPSKDSPFSSPHSARIGTRSWPSRLDLNSRSQASARSMIACRKPSAQSAAISAPAINFARLEAPGCEPVASRDAGARNSGRRISAAAPRNFGSQRLKPSMLRSTKVGKIGLIIICFRHRLRRHALLGPVAIVNRRRSIRSRQPGRQ
jgi:hypothetical protein